MGRHRTSLLAGKFLSGGGGGSFLFFSQALQGPPSFSTLSLFSSLFPFQEDVDKLRGSLTIKHTLAERGAEKLWELCAEEPFVPALGCLTGGQAVQCAKAGLKSIYCSGWQVAADANSTGNVYPDQVREEERATEGRHARSSRESGSRVNLRSPLSLSLPKSLYAVDSVPKMVSRINKALARADQVEHAEGGATRDWFLPIVADAEAGFGGPLNCFELMKAMIEAGAAGVHFEDQLSSEKKCGHLGGKVLVPTAHFIRSLVAARLAADVLDVPTVLIARTDAHSAGLLTSDVDPRDAALCTGERTPEG